MAEPVPVDPTYPGRVARPGWQTRASMHLPWLRITSGHVHIVDATTEREVEGALRKQAYSIAKIDGPTSAAELFKMSGAALRMPAGHDGWAGWWDWLTDLASFWPETDRLALLWTNADALLERDISSWKTAAQMLDQAGEFCAGKQAQGRAEDLAEDFVPFRLMVFESFLFLDGRGAAKPPYPSQSLHPPAV